MIGTYAGKCKIGKGSIALGKDALKGGSSTVSNNCGCYNLTLVQHALKGITTGGCNIAIGYNAGCNQTGAYNTYRNWTLCV